MVLLALFGARRARAVGDRHLRRAGVRRGAARARVRHPAGARRRPPVDPVAGAAQGLRTRRRRASCSGLVGALRADALPAEPAVRRRRARPRRCSRRDDPAAGRRRRGVLHPGAPGDADRSDGRVARRVRPRSRARLASLAFRVAKLSFVKRSHTLGSAAPAERACSRRDLRDVCDGTKCAIEFETRANTTSRHKKG